MTMLPASPSRLGAAVDCFFLVCITCFIIALAYNHFNLIFHRFPLDYNEAGILVTTSAIAQWVNPYSLESQPSLISLYPVLYNIIVAPLSHVFGNSFELHRAASALFILGSCCLSYFLCRRESGGRIESLAAAALVYAGLLYYSTPIASPNALGLLLFLGAITVPWINGFSARSLGVSIVLGILAFYTKQYFVASLGYVALYIFLGDSKKRAIYFGFASLAVFIPVLFLVHYTSPYYLEDTFFAVQSSAKLAASGGKVIEQLKEYVLIYFPLFIILAIVLGNKLRLRLIANENSKESPQARAYLNFFDFRQPLLLIKPDYIWFCCACSLMIFVLLLGKNNGTHMVYALQLISPFFIVGTLALMCRLKKWRLPLRALLVIAFYNSYVMLPSDFSVNEENWVKIREKIANADDVYASTLVLKEVIAKGDPIYLSGGTRYFLFGSDKPAFLLKADRNKTVGEVWERYVKNIQKKIRNQEFDLLLIDMWMPLPNSQKDKSVDTQTLISQFYKVSDSVQLPLMNKRGGGVFGLRIWTPITSRVTNKKVHGAD
jgi:4-amino-4-deoxy-L-arabinose transferase-like glycosyltransferase